MKLCRIFYILQLKILFLILKIQRYVVAQHLKSHDNILLCSNDNTFIYILHIMAL